MLIILMFIFDTTFSQIPIQKHYIHFGYTKSHFGKEYCVNYNRIIKKHAILIGLNYLKNPEYFPDAENYTYRHRFYGYSYGQRIIPTLQYSRFIHTPFLNQEKLYLFINSQLIASGIKKFDLYPKGTYIDPITNEIKYYYIKQITEDRNIVYGINNSVGIGIFAHITKNTFINMQCGFSNTTLNYKVFQSRYWLGYEFDTFFQITCGYSFNTKN